MFKKILIANRGEIAVRVIQTCKDMNIKTVAVYSDADKTALHVLEADEAVHIGPSDPSQSYLAMDKIIGAALKTRAQAIHPGYGFLSENPEFVEKCTQAEIVFIGPSAQAIRKMGDKITSRKIMMAGGVPITPGLTGSHHTLDEMGQKADEIGYPVLIKATAGGGGKGIRIVHSQEELSDACESASREAKNAFGNPDIYLEKFFPRARHIEFQILADNFGNTIHLLERECSIQRRHQKIIEETPSPAVSPSLREEMGNTAVTAAKAAEYVNAGTIEFLLDDQNRYYFLEMNTRLQVEHPVTEMITGIDLVRQQLEIAAGNPLTLTQSDISARGHAIECRIYAEDPENDFFPSPGKIEFFKEPGGPGIRNDSGIYSGCTVPVEYDPILSKLTTHGETRDQTIAKMIKALKSYIVLGVKTPIDFLIDILSSPPFKEGDVFTNFIDTHFSTWKPTEKNRDLACLAFLVDEVCKKKNRSTDGDEKKQPPGPFHTLGNWNL
ncbi:MAG: acetyl-CoA carboxylase biotin carboxylase subunit [Desulfobacteraceae bacterium]|nr:acetyl-CoA carboxylase biotin carboxylase subunit [Desulfobacteraceae bacterium]